MTNWRRQLRDHDPAADAIVPERADEMRRVVVEAARAATAQHSPWPWRFAFAAVALTLLAGGAGDDGRAARGTIERAGELVAPSTERRQLQFSTPGGTRIIWELNPAFSLTETLP
jgi:hypothetical protein